MTSKEVLEFSKKNKVVMVDLKFVDFPGTWQHFTIPIEELTDSVFTEGSGFDGSSIRGWQAIDNSDMMVVPDPEKVSRTTSRRRVQSRIASVTSATGLTVGCDRSSSIRPAPNVFTPR